jgi:4-aminobutyrate aminotransferase/(S)-3-amino-2-methylpropionate transaminase
VGCAAALAVIDVIAEENLVEAANRIGALFKDRLQALQGNYPQVIGEVRADHGAMIAIELVKGGDAEQPDADLTKALVAEAYRNGLVVLSCGVRGNVFRFLPALTISDELIEEGLDILEACFERLCA